MLSLLRSSLALLVIAPLVGCATGQSGDPDPGSADNLTDRLTDPVELAFVPSVDGSFARVSAVTLRDGEVTEVEVRVTGGSLTLSLDDAGLRVESLEVTAADVTMGPGVMPPDGATLTGISVGLAAPLAVELGEISDTAAASAGALPVDLRWAVVLDHGTVDLAPIRLTALPFELSVEMAAGGDLAAHLTASEPGAFWSWAGIFELRDLELDLVATSAPGPVD